MSKLDIYMAMAGTHYPHGKPFFPAKPKESKKCLECDKQHFHNNDWCSPECCKTWRLKKNGQA